MQKIQQALECLSRQEYSMALKLIEHLEQKQKNINNRDKTYILCIKALSLSKSLQFEKAKQIFQKILEECTPIDQDFHQYLFYISQDLNKFDTLRPHLLFANTDSELKYLIQSYLFQDANTLVLKLYSQSNEQKYLIFSCHLQYLVLSKEQNEKKKQFSLTLLINFLNKINNNNYDNVTQLRIKVLIQLKKYELLVKELDQITPIQVLEAIQEEQHKDDSLKEIYEKQGWYLVDNMMEHKIIDFERMKIFLKDKQENRVRESVDKQLVLIKDNWSKNRNIVKNLLHMKMFTCKNEAQMQNNLCEYSNYFCDTLEFFEEVTPYLMSKNVVSFLIEKLQTISHEGIKQYLLELNIIKLKIYYDIQISNLFQLLLEQYNKFFNLIDKSIQIEKGQRCWTDETIILMFDFYYPIKENKNELIYLLEMVFHRSPYNFDIALRLFLIYCDLEYFDMAYNILLNLDIKAIQFETLAHLFLRPVLYQDYQLSPQLYQQIFNFYSEVQVQSRENLITAIKHDNPYLLQQFYDYEIHIKDSYSSYLYKALFFQQKINQEGKMTFNLDNLVLQPQTKLEKNLHDYLGVFNIPQVFDLKQSIKNFNEAQSFQEIYDSIKNFKPQTIQQSFLCRKEYKYDFNEKQWENIKQELIVQLWFKDSLLKIQQKKLDQIQNIDLILENISFIQNLQFWTDHIKIFQLNIENLKNKKLIKNEQTQSNVKNFIELFNKIKNIICNQIEQNQNKNSPYQFKIRLIEQVSNFNQQNLDSNLLNRIQEKFDYEFKQKTNKLQFNIKNFQKILNK